MPEHFLPTVLLRLRWLQLRRAFPPYGLVMLMLAVCVAVWLLTRAVSHDATYAHYIAGGTLFTVWGLHQRRPDHHFLRLQVRSPKGAMAMEYALVVFPLAIALGKAGSWPWAGAVLGGVLFAWMPVVRTGTVRGSWLRQQVPVRSFEWRAFIQATHPFGVILWSTAMAFSWIPVLPLFLIGAVVLLVCGEYEACEPRSMLLATAQDPGELLHVKVWGTVRLTMIAVTPVLLAATAFHPVWWWVHVLFGFGMLTLVAYAVVLKYANYVPHERLSANGANMAVATVFAILPGLSLVPLVMLLTEWPKAKANLRSHFHDHPH